MIATAETPTKPRNYFSPTGHNKFPLVGNAPTRGYPAAVGANSYPPKPAKV